MKTKTYTGVFKNDDGHAYKLKVECFGFIQAFFLLTADAIRSGRHYQLSEITDEDGKVKVVDSSLVVLNIQSLLS